MAEIKWIDVMQDKPKKPGVYFVYLFTGEKYVSFFDGKKWDQPISKWMLELKNN